jgi:hypothetical protein
MPVEKRAMAGALTSASRMGAVRGAGREAVRRAGAGFSSTSVFQSPQPGQRPCHFGLWLPQEEHVKTLREGTRPR